MANNRMFLKCGHCLETYCLAKRMVGGYYRSVAFDDDDFEKWLDKHEWGQCFGGGRHGVPILDCYTISYESEEQIDRQALGVSQAEAISRMKQAESKAKALERQLDDLRNNFTMKLNQKMAEYIEETRRQFQQDKVEAGPEEGS